MEILNSFPNGNTPPEPTEQKPRTEYDSRIEEIMRGDGLSLEPDYDLIDRIREQELYDEGIYPYAGLM